MRVDYAKLSLAGNRAENQDRVDIVASRNSLLMVVVAPAAILVPVVAAASLAFLALLGAIGARAGGARIVPATVRVAFWGALAMALTAGIGMLVGTAV